MAEGLLEEDVVRRVGLLGCEYVGFAYVHIAPTLRTPNNCNPICVGVGPMVLSSEESHASFISGFVIFCSERIMRLNLFSRGRNGSCISLIFK